MRIKDPKKLDEFIEKSNKLHEKQGRALAKAQKAKSQRQQEKYEQQALKALIDDGNLMREYFDFDDDTNQKTIDDDYDDGL